MNEVNGRNGTCVKECFLLFLWFQSNAIAQWPIDEWFRSECSIAAMCLRCTTRTYRDDLCLCVINWNFDHGPEWDNVQEDEEHQQRQRRCRTWWCKGQISNWVLWFVASHLAKAYTHWFHLVASIKEKILMASNNGIAPMAQCVLFYCT